MRQRDSGAEPAADRYVILLTLDGVRMQDLFGGMDPVIANAPEEKSGIYEIEVMKERYWRDTPEQRREALMPFFWKTLVPAGVISATRRRAARSRSRTTSGSRTPATPRS